MELRDDTKKAMYKALKENTQAEALAVLQKYSSPFVPTDRGMHYYNTLVKNYMQNIPMHDEKLLLLLGLHTHGARMSKSNLDIGEEMINEIKEKIGDIEEADIRHIQHYLMEGGNLIVNPLFDKDFSNTLYDKMEDHGL